MHKAALVVLIALALIPHTSAASVAEQPLDFLLPAGFEGAANVTGAARALFVFEAPIVGFEVELVDAIGTWTNDTDVWVVHYDPYGEEEAFPVRNGEPTQANVAIPALTLTPGRPGLATLYIEADAFSFESSGGAASVIRKSLDKSIGEFFASSFTDRHPIIYPDVPEGEAYIMQSATSQATVRLALTGVSYVSWANLAVDCHGALPCPDGGGTRFYGTTLATGDGVGYEEVTYTVLKLGRASGTAAGTWPRSVIGGPALTFDVDGTVRLPLAHGQAPCEGCKVPEDQTFTATGRVHLEGLRITGANSAQTQVSGDLDSVRFDEQSIDPTTLSPSLAVGAAIGVGVAGVVIAKLVGLIAQFTRHLRDPLENPRRRLIYDTILQHPGTGFRELVRRSGVASGTARHHLTILERHKLVVEHRSGATLRFFENHGKFAHNWGSVVLLRDPALAAIHSWLSAHPNSNQKQIVAGMKLTENWSRSTTQHRLSRLEDGGMVAMRSQGRLKIYSVVAPGAKPAAPAVGATFATPAAPMQPLVLAPPTPSS